MLHQAILIGVPGHLDQFIAKSNGSNSFNLNTENHWFSVISRVEWGAKMAPRLSHCIMKLESGSSVAVGAAVVTQTMQSKVAMLVMLSPTTQGDPEYSIITTARSCFHA